jgi:hypothetical protein
MRRRWLGRPSPRSVQGRRHKSSASPTLVRLALSCSRVCGRQPGSSRSPSQTWANLASVATGTVAPGRRPANGRVTCSSDRKRFIVLHVNPMSSHQPAAGTKQWNTKVSSSGAGRGPHIRWHRRSQRRPLRCRRPRRGRHRCRTRPRRSGRTTIVDRSVLGARSRQPRTGWPCAAHQPESPTRSHGRRAAGPRTLEARSRRRLLLPRPRRSRARPNSTNGRYVTLRIMRSAPIHPRQHNNDPACQPRSPCHVHRRRR